MNRYYIPGTDDNFLKDLYNRFACRKVPEFPKTVQIQTITGCNAACVFCPYPDSYDKVPKGKITDELFEKIVDEIADYGVTRRISPYLMNEPFLDKTILEKSRYIKRKIPRSKLVITTNAGVLSREIVDDLVRDNPFNAIYISMQGLQKEAYEDSMRGSLVFEKTKENVEYLIGQKKEHMPELNIVITMIKTSLIDAESAVKYWKSLGVDSKYTALENRGGNISNFDELNVAEKRVFKDCSRLFKHAYIMFNGDLVICCTDYYKTMVLGNIAESSIYEVWNSKRAVDIRQKFIKGDLSENPLCAKCEIAQ